MDTAKFRKKVLLDLIASPWTIIPGMLGFTALIAAWVEGNLVGSLSFLGICGLLVAAGALATRWLFGLDKIAARTLERWQLTAQRRQEAALDKLDVRLQRDQDPRTEGSLRELRAVYSLFKKDSRWAESLNSEAIFDISSKIESLFQESLAALRHSAELWESAARMRTRENKQALLEKRERILEEVERSIRQLAKTVDGVQTLKLDKGDPEHLARIRRELDESLEVAKKVEERMRSLENEVGESLTQSGLE